MSVESLLRTVSFFDGLTDAQLADLARAGATASWPAGQQVFQEGDQADSM